MNKVATAVQLRFFPRLSGLPEAAQARLKVLAGAKLTADGDILITAGEHRTQEPNRRAARARLRALLERALRPPKHRKATKPSHSAVQRRLENKKRRSDIKRTRREMDS